MFDTRGNKLYVDDLVVVSVVGNKYLAEATVLKVTPKGATVEYMDKDGKLVTASRLHNQIVKV